MNSDLEKKILASLIDGKLPCARAFQIARELKVTPKEVGEVCNNLHIKIRSCQLGCFP